MMKIKNARISEGKQNKCSKGVEYPIKAVLNLSFYIKIDWLAGK